VVSTDYDTQTTPVLAQTITSTDETGRQRRSATDGFGRLVEADEPGDPYSGIRAQGSIDIGQIKTTFAGGEPAKPATGSVTISSSTGEQCYLTVCQTGSVSISFNNGGEVDSVSYGSGDFTSTVATRLASAINNFGHSPCYATATSSGATVSFTKTAHGRSGHRAISASYKAPAPFPIVSTGTLQTANSKTGAPGCLGTMLSAGQNLLLGQCLNSANGRFVLVLQTDGNLVLYDDTPDPNPWTPLWSTGTYGRGVDHAYMQSDGN